MEPYCGDARGIEIAGGAAEYISRQLRGTSCYVRTDRELRRGATVLSNGGCQTLRMATQAGSFCPTCGALGGGGLLNVYIPTNEFRRDPVSVILGRFAAALDAIGAELSAVPSPILTFDLPVPEGMDCAGRAVGGNIALRFVRYYDIVADRFIHRFDVLYCPASSELVAAFTNP